MKKITSFIFLWVFLFAPFNPVQALTLNVVDDAYVQVRNPTPKDFTWTVAQHNFGGGPSIHVNSIDINGTLFPRDNGYARFDISSLPKNITGVDMRSAQLRLYIREITSGGKLLITLHEDKAWSEKTVKVVADFPAALTKWVLVPLDNSSASADKDSFVIADITGLLKSSIKLGHGSFNISFKSSESLDVVIASKEAGGNAMQIEVDLGLSAGEVTSYEIEDHTIQLTDLDPSVPTKGDQGIQGYMGQDGAKGDTGDQGIQGQTGNTGLTGATGEQGARGPPGALNETGLIVMWSGTLSAIPDGWVLCDGKNGAPNLLNRFIVGAGGSYNPSTTGGKDQIAGHALTVAEMPSHTHAYTAVVGGNQNADMDNDVNTYRNGGRRTGATGTNKSHTHGDNKPLYYALAFIYKL